MSESEIEYYKLRIMINTNNNKQIELKPEMFIFDSPVSGDGPYVCSNINYSKSSLMLLPHRDQVDIFMNETRFKEFCITSKGKKGIETTKDADKRTNIMNNNVIIMLNALFPVSFPISDTTESLCSMSNMPTDSLYLKLTKPAGYTYLNIGETTTVTRVVWLNVMHHHPAYIKLYNIVKKYYKRMHTYILDVLSEEYKQDTNNAPPPGNNGNSINNIMDKLNIGEWQDNNYINNVNETIKFIKELSLDEDDENSIDTYDNENVMWKLYYMFKGLRKNTQEYNDFMEKYVEKFINVKDKELIRLEEEKEKLEEQIKTNPTDKRIQARIDDLDNKISDRKNRRYSANITDEQRQASNEKRFNDSVQKELQFHFDYIKELTEYMPLKRESISLINDTTGIDRRLFKDNILNVAQFVNAMMNADSSFCTTVDKMEDGKYYEIQVAIGLVGGKVTADNAKQLSCNFNSYKMAKQIKDYADGSKAYPMYPYVDLKDSIQKLANPVKKGGKYTRKQKKKRVRSRKTAK